MSIWIAGRGGAGRDESVETRDESIEAGENRAIML